MRKIEGIDREALELVLHASRSNRPNEFAGVLRARDGVISEILFLPGTFSSEMSAVIQLHMLPIDNTACGTVHSHPSPNANPSNADLALFAKFGTIHLIIAHPYSMASWKAYDHHGNRVKLKVINSVESGNHGT